MDHTVADTMKELHRSEFDDEDNVYNLTRVVTESVEKRYSSGELDAVSVTATWKQGVEYESNHSSMLKHEWDRQHTVNALYAVDDNDIAELRGFYADTSKTGELLWRENLYSLRMLDYTAEVVDNSTDDGVNVVRALTTLNAEYEKGVED
jgi:hypothetical protein